MHRYLFNKPSDQTIIELIKLGGLLMKEVNEFCFLFLSTLIFSKGNQNLLLFFIQPIRFSCQVLIAF